MMLRVIAYLALLPLLLLAGCGPARATCSDGMKNGGEGDVDCGGICMNRCAVGKGCRVAADCVTRSCAQTICAAPSCSDQVTNGEETDADCGGPAAGQAGGCSKCAEARWCGAAADCASGVCMDDRCQAPGCADAVKNGFEGDVDCGGNCVTLCSDGKGCTGDKDCVSRVCAVNACAPPSCVDLVKTAADSDADCGGPSAGAGLPGTCAK
ncbi:MAG: hypothetical protein EXR69_16415, partial [Myxococcales bacterium]|nr:hypothetical protein [Myxococcales bacterium]